MSNMLPRRYQYLNEMLTECSPHIPLQWIQSYMKMFMKNIPHKDVEYLWNDLRLLSLNSLTPNDKKFIKGLQDVVMETIIEMEHGSDTTEYYFYLYTILYVKTFPENNVKLEWVHHKDKCLNDMQNYIKNYI